MAITPLGGAGPTNISGAGSPQKTESFGKVLKGQSPENAPIPVNNPPADAKVAQDGAELARIDSLDVTGRWTREGVAIQSLALKSPDGTLDLHGTVSALAGYPGDGELRFDWRAQDVAYDVTFSIAGVGASGAAKGKATGIGAGIPRIDTTFDLKAKDAGPLATFAGMSAADASKLGAVSLAGTAVSGADDLTYDVTVSMAGIGGQGQFKGKLDGLSGTPRVDTRLDFAAKFATVDGQGYLPGAHCLLPFICSAARCAAWVSARRAKTSQASRRYSALA